MGGKNVDRYNKLTAETPDLRQEKPYCLSRFLYQIRHNPLTPEKTQSRCSSRRILGYSYFKRDFFHCLSKVLNAKDRISKNSRLFKNKTF